MSVRRTVASTHAPEAIGPYHQAIVHDGLVWCSGQIALDPETGEMVGGGDVAAEARRALQNLESVLRAAGTDLHQALRCTVYLVDMADFAAVNEVYATFFEGTDPPARACVAVAALPKGARVEIECVARLPSS